MIISWHAEADGDEDCGDGGYCGGGFPEFAVQGDDFGLLIDDVVELARKVGRRGHARHCF